MALRTLVVGFGGIAAGLAADSQMARYFRYATHGQVLRDHPGFEWTSVVDPDPVAREAARRDWGIAEVAANIDDLPRPERFDAVVITSPAKSRLGVLRTLKGLRAAIVEKPLGPDLAVAEGFIAEAERRGIMVQVNFWRRGDACLAELASGGLTKSVGRMQAAFGVFGNGLFNNGSHLVDEVRMLLGEIAWVQALGQPEPAHGPITGDVHLPFALGLCSGLVAALQPLDFRNYREVSLDLWGDRGRLQILHEGLTLSLHKRRANRGLENAYEIASDEASKLPITVGTALYRLYDNLAGAVVGENAIWSGLTSAMRTENILRATLESAQRGGAQIAV